MLAGTLVGRDMMVADRQGSVQRYAPKRRTITKLSRCFESFSKF
jgi:hypothetical protein